VLSIFFMFDVPSSLYPEPEQQNMSQCQQKRLASCRDGHSERKKEILKGLVFVREMMRRSPLSLSWRHCVTYFPPRPASCEYPLRTLQFLRKKDGDNPLCNVYLSYRLFKTPFWRCLDDKAKQKIDLLALAYPTIQSKYRILKNITRHLFLVTQQARIFYCSIVCVDRHTNKQAISTSLLQSLLFFVPHHLQRKNIDY
jgi:hypothetical protein